MKSSPAPLSMIAALSRSRAAHVAGLFAIGLVVTWLLTFNTIDYAAMAGVSLQPHWPDPGPILRASPVVQIHLLAALAALALGAMMMASRKGARFHRTAGWVWVGLMGLTAGSSLFITGLNGGAWSLIHLLSGWTLLSLPLALFAARRHQVKQHRRAMMGLFYGGLIIAGALAFLPGRLLWVTFF